MTDLSAIPYPIPSNVMPSRTKITKINYIHTNRPAAIKLPDIIVSTLDTPFVFIGTYYMAPPDKVYESFNRLCQQLNINSNNVSCVLSPGAPYPSHHMSTCSVNIYVTGETSETVKQLLDMFELAMDRWRIIDDTHPASLAFSGTLVMRRL